MRVVLATLFCLFLALPAWGGPVLPDTIVLSPVVLLDVRNKIRHRDRAVQPAYDKLMAEAGRAMEAPVRSVTRKPKPGPSGDKHDYWSISPYWWPDPKKSGGRIYVKRDGERNPEAASDKYDRERLNSMAKDVETLALAYYLSENELYAIKAVEFVRAWFFNKPTRMNPHMINAQARPGTSDGHHTGVVETRDLIRVVDAALLLERSHAWTPTDTRKLKAWFTEYLNWLMHSDLARKEAQMENNHGTWFDAQVAVFAFFTGDEALAATVVASVNRRRIARQINADGSMPQELKRSRPLHYTFFNIEALFVLAAVGERMNIALWTWQDPMGMSIRQALDHAAPHLDPESEWSHGERGAFSPDVYIPLFRRAALVYKDDSYLDYLQALPHETLNKHRSMLCH